jgi:hypothetical protein
MVRAMFQRVLLVALSLVSIFGCINSDPARDSQAVSLADFGGKSTLAYHIETEGDRHVDIAGRGTAIKSEESFVLEFDGDDQWLNVTVSQFQTSMTANGRRVLSMKLNEQELTGWVAGESLAQAAGASETELEAIRARLVGKPLGRIQLNGNQQEIRREKLAPPESEVFISWGVLDYPSLLLAPQKLTKPTWTRTCTFPLGGNLSARGELTYRISPDDWKQRQTKSSWPVHVEGAISADGTHTATSAKKVAEAKSGKLQREQVTYRDSLYRFRGDFVFSRQTGQFDSGTLHVDMQQTVQHSNGQESSMSGTQTIRLTAVTADRDLPLPTTDQPLDKSQHDVVIDDESRSLVRDSVAVDHHATGANWQIDLDVAFPKGLAGRVLSPDGGTLFLLTPSGKLLRIRLKDFVLERSAGLKTRCTGLAWSDGRLVVSCPSVERLVVLDQSLEPLAVWKTSVGDSMSGCPSMPWVVISDSRLGLVRILDIEKGAVKYHLTGENLSSIRLEAEGLSPRSRPTKLVRARFSPDGKHLVVIDIALHRLTLRGGELYYEEDSRDAKCDGDTLLFSDDGHVAIHSSATNLMPPRMSGPSLQPGIHVYRITSLQWPVRAFYPAEGLQLLGFYGEDLLGVFGDGGGRTVSSGSRYAKKTQFLKTGTRESIDVIPLRDSFLHLGRKSSAYFDKAESLPEAFRNAVGKLTLAPVSFEVEELDLQASVVAELSKCPSLLLPARLKYKERTPNIVWSADGKVLFALLGDGSIVRIDADARRCTHRCRLTDPSMQKQNSVQYITSCGAGLVVSDSSGTRVVVLDPDTLTCRGHIDGLLTSGLFVGNPVTSKGVVRCRDQPCWFEIDLERETYRRLYTDSIEGLSDEQRQVAQESKLGCFPQAFSSNGELLLASIDGKRYALRPGDPWRIEHSVHEGDQRLEFFLDQDTLALAPSKEHPYTTILPWTRADNADAAVKLPRSTKFDCLGYSPQRQSFYLFQPRDRTLLVFNQQGEQVGEHRDVYTGKISNGFTQIVDHPARRDILLCFSSDKALAWFDPDE